MKAKEKKVLAGRLQELGAKMMTAAAYVTQGNMGVAYSYLYSAQSELDKITFDVVKELGAIEERTR